MLAGHWQLPESICTMIRCHHEPFKGGEHERDCLIIHLANHIVVDLGIGAGKIARSAALHSEALLGLGLAMEDVDAVKDELAQQFEQAIDLVNS